MGFLDFLKKKETKGGTKEIVEKTPLEKKDFAYFFMITSALGENGKLQAPPPNPEGIAKLLFDGLSKACPSLKEIPIERFIPIYPKDIEDAGAWAGNVTSQDLNGNDEKIAQVADKYVLPYFNVDKKTVKEHCKEKKNYYTPNTSQVNCLFIADCDLRLLAPEGSAPRLAAEKREKPQRPIPGTDKLSDKFVLIFTGYYESIRNFFEKDGVPMETKVKNFLGKSDAESMMKMTDFVINVRRRTSNVTETLRKEYIAKGVPGENVWSVEETGKFYADLPWKVLIESEIPDIETRRKMVAQPLFQHFSNYLKTKGYAEKDISNAMIFFPDQIAKSEDPKLFKDGAIGLSAYVVCMMLDMNDTVREEMQNAKKEKEEKLRKDVAAGKRVYYAAWVDSGISSMLGGLGEMPLSKMQLSKTFNISVGDIRTLTKKDWNPPAYGKLSKDELLEKSSAGAQRFHKQLKEASKEYLLKQGYTHEEIDANYRFVGFDGRGGENFALTAVFEMNLK